MTVALAEALDAFNSLVGRPVRGGRLQSTCARPMIHFMRRLPVVCACVGIKFPP